MNERFDHNNDNRNTDMKTTTNKLNLNGEIRDNSLINAWQKLGLPDCLRSRQSLIPARHAAMRAYLRDLRAAEMTAWEMTGGDYLISR
jgi:hypothetical protein